MRAALALRLPSLATTVDVVVRDKIARVVFGHQIAFDVRVEDLDIIGRITFRHAETEGSVGFTSCAGETVWIRGAHGRTRVQGARARTLRTVITEREPFTIPAPGGGLMGCRVPESLKL
jgi:hypothetical protein